MDRRDVRARARAAMAADARRMAGAANPVAALLRAMRPRQWVKNLLVFVPMLAAHALTGAALIESLFAFLAFSMCASSACLLSDTLDAEHDRQHPLKRNRPVASGALAVPLALALAASVVLAIFSLALSAWVEPWLLLVVSIYFAGTVMYSLWLERLLMVDIVALAMLYCVRIIGGSAITHIEPSFWLLAFWFFLSLSLALLKRHSEPFDLPSKDENSGHGYTTGDKTLVAMMGVNSGFLAVLIVILYINSPNVLVLYRHPIFLIGIVPLLVFWLGRLWTLSFRGQVNEDPLLYVSQDPVSIVIIVACLALAGAAAYQA